MISTQGRSRVLTRIRSAKIDSHANQPRRGAAARRPCLQTLKETRYGPNNPTTAAAGGRRATGSQRLLLVSGLPFGRRRHRRDHHLPERHGHPRSAVRIDRLHRRAYDAAWPPLKGIDGPGVWRYSYGHAPPSDRLSVSDYYGGSTTSLAATPTPPRTKYIRTKLAEPSENSLTPH